MAKRIPVEKMPFGNPDGSRVDIESGNYGFIEFSERKWGALATQPEDLQARVFFGRKGSGKTIYLRRLEAYAASKNDLYSVPERPHSVKSDYNPLETKLIVQFSQYFDFETVTEAWQQIWRLAILRSVAAQILFSQDLNQRFDEDELEPLRKYSHAPGVETLECELGIYDNLRLLIGACYSKSGAKELLEHSAWINLAVHLKKLIPTCPPLCFYIDAIDDEFAHAPMYWVRCQLGLFYQVMKLLRDSTFGGRLHVFICLRDLVHARVLISEHAMRYMDDDYIRLLLWDFQATRHFLAEKILGLPKSYYLAYDQDGQPIERWLGLKDIYNSERNIREPIEQYLLRHTRLLPRDVIIMGNEICKAIIAGKLDLNDPDREKRFCEVVSMCACNFGNEQLRITCNQISSDQMPPLAAEDGYSEPYTSIEEYESGMLEDLKQLIRQMGYDRFASSAISKRKASIKRRFEDADPFSALWQNGLLGYIEHSCGQEHTIFYGDQYKRSFKLPKAKEYIFHPCIIDAVNIKPVGNKPVLPYIQG